MDPAAIDVLIISGGVAGSSPTLTLVRQHHTVNMFDTLKYRFDNSYYLQGLIGQEHVLPKDLVTKAHSDLVPFKDFTLKNTEIVKLEKDGNDFVATSKDGKSCRGRKVILAHGVATIDPQIEGYNDCWSKGIFHNIFAQAYNSDLEGYAGVLADDHVCPIKLHGNFVQDLKTELTPYVGDYKVADFFNETSTKGVYAAGNTMTRFNVLPNAVASGAQAAASFAVALQEVKYSLPSVWG